MKELSSCLRYAFSEAVGFPLASSRADVLALWPAEEPGESIFCFVLFLIKKRKSLDPPFRVRITYSSVQKRWEEEILGNRRGWRRERESLLCVLD